MSLNGKCLCGAVSFDIAQEKIEIAACHCDMCRAWSGGVFMGFVASADQVALHGEDNVRVFASSEWAERGFCKTCGSSLFYRVTAPGPHSGNYHFGAGTLQDWKGNAIGTEFFIDKKPDGYGLSGTTQKMTEAEVFAMFAASEGA